MNQAAVVQQGSESAVFVIESGRLQRVVLPGPSKSLGELVPTPMLKANQRVVLRPAKGLRDGQRVRLSKP